MYSSAFLVLFLCEGTHLTCQALMLSTKHCVSSRMHLRRGGGVEGKVPSLVGWCRAERNTLGRLSSVNLTEIQSQ